MPDPVNPYTGHDCAGDDCEGCSCESSFAEGVAAERARILALLDEPRAYWLALAEYAARREQGHDRFEAMRLAVAAVRALVGGDDAPGGPCEDAAFAARREAFREAVEALREAAMQHDDVGEGTT